MKFTSFPIRTGVKKIWKGLTAPQITSPSRMPGNLELRMLCQRVRLPIRSMACEVHNTSDPRPFHHSSNHLDKGNLVPEMNFNKNLYDSVECWFLLRRAYFRHEKKRKNGNVRITKDPGFSSSCNHLLMFFQLGCRKSGWFEVKKTLHRSKLLKKVNLNPEFRPSSWTVQIDSHDAKCIDLGEHSHGSNK